MLILEKIIHDFIYFQYPTSFQIYNFNSNSPVSFNPKLHMLNSPEMNQINMPNAKMIISLCLVSFANLKHAAEMICPVRNFPYIQLLS